MIIFYMLLPFNIQAMKIFHLKKINFNLTECKIFAATKVSSWKNYINSKLLSSNSHSIIIYFD